MTYESGSYYNDGATHTRVAVFSNPNVYQEFIVFPNPNNGNFTLLFKDNIKANYYIEIFNILSERVFLQKTYLLNKLKYN